MGLPVRFRMHALSRDPSSFWTSEVTRKAQRNNLKANRVRMFDRLHPQNT